MNEFTNVTVVKQANIYFDGRVTSRSVVFPDGSKKTLGIMLPGEYEFGTEAQELMEILAGQLDIKLPGRDAWQHIDGEGAFVVPEHSKFQLRVHQVVDYCCSYG